MYYYPIAHNIIICIAYVVLTSAIIILICIIIGGAGEDGGQTRTIYGRLVPKRYDMVYAYTISTFYI